MEELEFIQDLEEELSDEERKQLAKEVAGELASGSGGFVQYIKCPSSSVIKLLVPKGGGIKNKTWYKPFKNVYNGVESTSYLIMAVILDSDMEGAANKEQARYLKVAKTAILDILGAYEDWPDLFKVQGEVLKVNLKKTSGKPEWAVSPLKKTFNAAQVKYPTISIEEAAQKEEEKALKKESPKEEKPPVFDEDDLPF